MQARAKQSNVTPTNINADRATAQFNIDWSDGVSHAISFGLLRNACPCAQCRGGHENMSPEPAEDVFTIPLLDANITKLVNIEAIGNYAITPIWGDGHSHGIYNWHYLYTLGERADDARQRKAES
jgi:DUF971 family protein